MLMIKTRELLADPQWQDDDWKSRLHRQLAEEIWGRAMFRPWLESFATVSEPHDYVDDPANSDGGIERWLHEDVRGREAHWLAPGGAIDGTTVDVAVFEPPAQVFSFHGQVPESQVVAAPEVELDELIDLAAEALDGKFRRLVALREFGDVRVALWAGFQSRLWTDPEGIMHLRGKMIVAAMAVRDAAVAVPESGAETPAEPAEDSIEAERAALTAHLEEHAANQNPDPASEAARQAEAAPAPVVVDEEPVRHKYDEPAGDLREVEEEEVMDRSEDFGDVRRVPS